MGGGLSIASTAGATHVGVSYSYSVDRFVLDRAVSSDFTDEFNGTDLSPWLIIFGNPSESGGFAHLASPGTDDDFGYPVERTSIVLAEEGLVGSGDFTASSEWASVLPEAGQLFWMNIQEVSAPDDVFPLRNHSFGIGSDGVNYAVFLGVSDDADSGPGADPVSQEIFLIDAGDLDTLSNIVLRATFDDSTDELTFSFRIDGTNFVTPFDAVSVTSENVQFVLDAASAVPEPSSFFLFGTAAIAVAFGQTRGPRARSSA